MAHSGREPYLLTPGPLTTSITVKRAMLRDGGARDREFIALNARLRERLVALAGGAGTHVCVPLQGSGTFAIEAMLGTLVPRAGRLLVLVNGAYGVRMVRIARHHEREVVTLETPEDSRTSPRWNGRLPPTRRSRTSRRCTARPLPASSTRSNASLKARPRPAAGS